jgi:hypothetical protein
MKGKSVFTKDEAEEIGRLIRVKLKSDSNKQKGIRAKIRKLGFYASDFGLTGGYSERDFLNVIKTREKAAHSTLPRSTDSPLKSKHGRSSEKKAPSSSNSGSRNLMKIRDFKPASEIDHIVPHAPGVYAIRIKDPKKLPRSFKAELVSRNHNLIYIGIASQSLKRRMLGQELRARGHGTFFRSIGAVLGFAPPKGSLLSKKNKRNYSFSTIDEKKIISWINDNLLVNWIQVDEGYNQLETELILDQKPLLNIAKNPLAMNELSKLRAKCVAIANEQT